MKNENRKDYELALFEFENKDCIGLLMDSNILGEEISYHIGEDSVKFFGHNESVTLIEVSSETISNMKEKECLYIIDIATDELIPCQDQK